MEKLFHMSVVLAAGATTVWLMTRAQLSARASSIANEEIEAVPPKDVAELEESEETDLLASYWAGAIPEGTTPNPMIILSFWYIELQAIKLTERVAPNNRKHDRKTDCEEILDMLRFPEVYASYGSKMPRGYVPHEC